MAYVDPRSATRYGRLAGVGALCDPPSPPRKARKGLRGSSGLGVLHSPKAQEFSKRVFEIRDKFRDYRSRVGQGGQSTLSKVASWLNPVTAFSSAYYAATEMDVERASEALRVLYLEMIAARDSRTITAQEFAEVRSDWESVNAEVRGQAGREGTASQRETRELENLQKSIECYDPRCWFDAECRDKCKGKALKYALVAGAGAVGLLMLGAYVHGRAMRSR